MLTPHFPSLFTQLWFSSLWLMCKSYSFLWLWLKIKKAVIKMRYGNSLIPALRWGNSVWLHTGHVKNHFRIKELHIDFFWSIFWSLVLPLAEILIAGGVLYLKVWFISIHCVICWSMSKCGLTEGVWIYWYVSSHFNVCLCANISKVWEPRSNIY